MNLFDLLIVVTLVLAVIGGYRLGFLARVMSWAGLGLGLYVGTLFVKNVANYFTDSSPTVRLLAVGAFLLAAGMLGQGLGLALGAALHATLPVGMGLRQSDRVAGAAVGAVGILAIFWLLVPSLDSVPGNVARLARESAILGLIRDVAPRPPDTLQTLRRVIGPGLFPEVFQGRASPNVGPPPLVQMRPEVNERVQRSTVKVVGQACRRIQEGSGFAAAPDLVVTNAHVVAGEESTNVQTFDGRTLGAQVVAFDPNNDVAVLRVAGLKEAPLPMGDAPVGTKGAVYGHPGGGKLRGAPAEVRQRVTAVGLDIYDSRRTRRDVFILASELHPGDSGGALVNLQGTVIGVAFAIAPDRPSTAYALTNREVRPVLESAGVTPVSTGPCLVG